MEKSLQAKYKAKAQILKALAHPTRLFIVDELAQHGQRCVCELTEKVGADASTISKHLSILKNARIVDFEKRGTNIYYYLTMTCVMNFFTCIDQVIQKNIESQMTML
ncbi:MAG: helix-turn-helix transcriptional regulator [Chitinivibrionales bacterium]|nr:helix-turn-helix transcriptional regulator [Chitinivibrionales bacterium]